MIVKLDYDHYDIRKMKQTLEDFLTDSKISTLQITVDLNFTLKEEEQILNEICNTLPVALTHSFSDSGSKQYTFRRI